MAVFLTDEWFTEVENLTEQAGDLNLPPALQGVAMNLVVTDGPNGEINAYLEDGKLHKGSTEADTTLKLDQETLKAIAFEGDMNQAMNAFMTGKIRVEGDMSQLMSLQSAKPSQEQKELFKKISSMTEQA